MNTMDRFVPSTSTIASMRRNTPGYFPVQILGKRGAARPVGVRKGVARRGGRSPDHEKLAPVHAGIVADFRHAAGVYQMPQQQHHHVAGRRELPGVNIMFVRQPLVQPPEYLVDKLPQNMV